MARKTTHERYLGRRRSSQSEELTTNGASPRRGAHPKMTDETRDRASSPEIISTSLYAPAGGMARKTTHKRYLGRRRSSQSEEITTNGASPRRGTHPKMTDETRDRASSPELTSTSVDTPAGGMARKTTHERYLGRRRSSQSQEMTTNGASPRRGRTENDQ
eukprot:scaffold38388_cov67-Phaeocystis_antarctica.AAC.1